MSTRREFVIAAAAGVVACQPTVCALAREQEAQRAAAGLPHRAAFEALAGQAFGITTATGRRTRLSLAAVHGRDLDPGHEQFSLVFRAPPGPALAAGRYSLDHARTGRFVLWLEPSGQRDDARRYRADLSLRV
jgi:hypothetical protein